jgi:hypothetical protein
LLTTTPSSLHISDREQNDEDAKVAMEEGRGVMILGRPCRTEPVKANRECRFLLIALGAFADVLPASGTFIIYSRRGDEITTDIAREILEPYGELNKCEVLSAQMQEAMSLPTAVLVEFAKFDPKRDLNSVSFSEAGATSDRVLGVLTFSHRLSASSTVTALTPST